MQTYRSLFIKVYTSDGKQFERFQLVPPPGKLFMREDLPLEMSKFVWLLKDQFEGNEFKAVKIRHNLYHLYPVPLAHA